MKFICLLLLAFFILTSAGCKTYRLTAADKAWIPYNENDTLIFSASTGEVDTVFVLGTGSSRYPADPLAIFPDHNETYGIDSRRSDPSPPPGTDHRYLEDAFVSVTASEHGTYVTIHFYGKNAKFYGGDFMDLKELEQKPYTSLLIGSKTYSDVIILEPRSNEYYERINFITKVYWSRSEGLLRYDKKEGVRWELVRKLPISIR